MAIEIKKILAEAKNIIEESKIKRKEFKEKAKQSLNKKKLMKCNITIHTAAAAAGAAGAIPIPVADAVPISGAQITMVITLGSIFHEKISDAAAKAIIAAAASSLLGRNLVKIIPVVGWAASASVAFSITEMIGWYVVVEFIKNQTPNNDNSSDDSLDENKNDQIYTEDEKINEDLILKAGETYRTVYEKYIKNKQCKKWLKGIDNILKWLEKTHQKSKNVKEKDYERKEDEWNVLIDQFADISIGDDANKEIFTSVNQYYVLLCEAIQKQNLIL